MSSAHIRPRALKRPAGTTPANGSSRRLRSNLDKAGCGCPPGKDINAAHHVVPKKAGGAIGDRLRACLARNNVDIDMAGNGICLPTKDPAATQALEHGEQGMHSNRYFQALVDRCEAAEQPGGGGVQNMLDQVRTDLSTGFVFW